MNAREEAGMLLELSDNSLIKAISLVESQLNALHTRAQVLISFCGIIITTTGFSGRLIAGTNTVAQYSIIAGLIITVLCALYIYATVGHIKWVTSRVVLADPVGSIEFIIARRNRKGRAYRFGGYLLFIGLIFYGFAISQMLLYPEPLSVPVR